MFVNYFEGKGDDETTSLTRALMRCSLVSCKDAELSVIFILRQ